MILNFLVNREIDILESNEDDNFDSADLDSKYSIKDNSVLLESDNKNDILEAFSQSSFFLEIMTMIGNILLSLKVDTYSYLN